jgi:hypothetical protein
MQSNIGPIDVWMSKLKFYKTRARTEQSVQLTITTVKVQFWICLQNDGYKCLWSHKLFTDCKVNYSGIGPNT